MRRPSNPLARPGRALALAAALLAAAAPAAAQQGQIPVGPDGEPLGPDRFLATQGSPFNLFASPDFANVTVNPGDRVEYCAENDPGQSSGVGCPYGFYRRDDGVTTISYRNGSWVWGVPSSEWEKAKDLVPSLDNALGGGWSVMTNIYTGRLGNQIIPKDGSLGKLHNNVNSSAGGCAAAIFWSGSNPLLPTSTCPPTWGPSGWLGAQELTRERFIEAYQANPSGFGFDFWRMDGAYADGNFDADRSLGSALAYGVAGDWSLDKAQALGNVVALGGVATAPQDPGWPLGIEVRTDAFKFDIPTLKDIVFFQALVVNRSEDVYGVGLSYDSLYIAWNSGAWFHSGFQNSSAYIDPARNAYFSTISGQVASPPCNGKETITDVRCGGGGTPVGDRWGAHAIVMLKSPIGDTRYKLFTQGDAASNPFYDPSHPLAGDTITFNHFHMCGFRQCNQNTWQRIGPDPDGMQRAFGMLSSTTQNVLGARALNSLSDANFWHTFRSEVYPDRSRGFNAWNPPGWNNSHRFTTVHWDPCGRRGCVEMWSDTLPNDGAHAGYINAYNNTGQIQGVGPIRLAAGDTTGFMLGFATSSNSKDEVEQMVDRIINTYLSFFLTPKAAPPPQIRAVTVNVGAVPTDRSIELFLSLDPLQWTDPFLASQADNFGTGDAAELNPDLEGALRERSEDNIFAIHIFKSCDNGGSYTTSASCAGAPATGGKFAALGWLPAFTFEVDKGAVPTRIVDTDVTPGRTYNYVAVAETRGAQFVVLSQDPSGRITGENVEFAPSLFNALSNNTDQPNVIRVRLPMTLAAGTDLAKATVTSQAGPARIAPEGFEPVEIGIAGSDQVAGTYRLVFGDSVVVNAPASGSTQVTLYRGGSPTTLTSSAEVTLNGLEARGGDVWAEAGLSAVLVGPGNTPLLVTSQLTGADATPGEFVSNDAFPGFFLSIANRPGQFAEQFYTAEQGGDVIRLTTTGQPSIVWNTSLAVRAGGSGEYDVDWSGPVFGPGAPFVVDFGNPGGVQQAVSTSLAARARGQGTVIPTAEQAEAIAAALPAADTALARRVQEGDFQQASLPFTVRNATAGREVQVAMLRRASNVRTLTTDEASITVEVPEDLWLPGDTLFFMEGGEVTWARVVLECSQNLAPPAQCNPVTAPPIRTNTPAVFASPTSRHNLKVRYFSGFTAESEFAFTITPARSGDQLAADEVRAALANVKVVPNPYLATSLTDAGTTSRVVFVGLPSAGKIRIYSLAGQFLQEITWSEADLSSPTTAQGDLYYNLRSAEGNLLASGLYLYVVFAHDASGREIGRANGKFVIIR